MKCKIFTVAALVTLAAALYGQARSITATKAYVDRRYADATNAVPSIVTNEVVTGYTAWTFTSDVPEIQSALEANPPNVRISNHEGLVEWEVSGWPGVEGYYIGAFHAYTDDESSLDLYFPAYYSTSGDEEFPVFATRSRIIRNALGLARLSDLTEAGVPASTVTNIARDVVNTVWDAKLGVAWEARMYDGHLYYIAVTNAPGGAQ